MMNRQVFKSHKSRILESCEKPALLGNLYLKTPELRDQQVRNIFSSKEVSLEELEILRVLLKLKLCIKIQHESEVADNYDISFIIHCFKHCFDDTKAGTIFDIFLLILYLNNEASLETHVNTVINKCVELCLKTEKHNMTSGQIDLVCNILQLLEFSIDVLLERNVTIIINNHEQLYHALNQFLKIPIKSIQARTILCCRNIIEFTKCTNLLEEIWELLKTFTDDETQSLKFTILCSFADYFIKNNNDHLCLDLSADFTFWHDLQNAIVSQNPLVRKQGLYLAKRCVDVCSSSECRVFVKIPSSEYSLFNWESDKSDNFSNAWRNLFVILETLEEKQSHLIIPALKWIPQLTVMHQSWTTSVLEIIIRHENSAVKKWGIMYTLQNVRLDFSEGVVYSPHCRFLISMLNALNDSMLYPEHNAKENNELSKGLVSFIAHVRYEVVNIIHLINWSSVPLFYITHALLQGESLNTSNDTQNIELHVAIKRLTRTAMLTHNVYIRSAIQSNILNFCICHVPNRSNINMFDLLDVLGEFREKESLKRGTNIWSRVTGWMEKSYQNTLTPGHIRSLLNNKIPGKAHEYKNIARFIILASDCKLVSRDTLANELKLVMANFDNCEHRLYASQDNQINALDLLNSLLIESYTVDTSRSSDVTRDIIVTEILSCSFKVLEYLKLKLQSVSEYIDVYLINKCLTTFSVFFKDSKLAVCLQQQLKSLIEKCAGLMTPQSNFMIHYFAIKLLDLIQQYLATNYITYEAYIITIYNIINIPLVHEKYIFSSNENLTRDLQTLRGKIASSFHQSLSDIRYVYINNIKNFNDQQVMEILSHMERSMDLGGLEILATIIRTLKIVLPLALQLEEHANLALDIVNKCWKETFQLRKTELFWRCIGDFIDMLFQPTVMFDCSLQATVYKYATEIMEQGKVVSGLANLLVTHLRHIGCNLLKWDSLSDIIIEGLLFGSVPRRDQRIENETCLFVSEMMPEINELITHNVYSDHEVRASTVLLVLDLIDSKQRREISETVNDYRQQLLVRLTEKLIERSDRASRNKLRYFADSQHHRFKHRLLQSLLVLQPYLSKPQTEQVLLWAADGLSLESHQPSVRYLQEWLIARILLSDSNNERVWRLFEKAADVRIGSLPSFIAIVFLMCKSILTSNEKEGVMFINKALIVILPWTMGQNYTLRLYAQIAIKKLYTLIKGKNLITDFENVKFDMIYNSLNTIMSHGNAAKNATKLESDVFLNKFDVNKHYSIQTIFFDLSLITSYSYDDLIPVQVFTDLNTTKFCYLNVTNYDDGLKYSKVIAWNVSHDNASKTNSGQIESDTKNVTGIENIQKKMIPWKCMTVNEDLCINETTIQDRKLSKGLVVVATLIGRAPNLGGLARTCEIFGVSEYVIESLKYIDDKQFQSLSVSAERWLNLTEVKPWQLSGYLNSMRNMGYCIVGAEQTAKSQCLSATAFPKKTVLLLGNEQEGIPAGLLPGLDLCVEVPQKGMVRSLNVHVTGALFIWEYAKQHMY